MALHGILLIDKPGGWTSHDVVARTRRLVGQKKIGHTGTLDPMATGLLVLCLGDGTRLVEYMTGHDKAYDGQITLGVRTATDDAEGEVLETRPVPALSDQDLRALEARFTGDLLQRPPAYSAVKVEGQRAYAAARRGDPLVLQPRPVRIHRLELRALAPDKLALRVECGGGTYVRSLARDIGEALACGAHLSALRRTHAGLFRIEQAVTLETLAAFAAAGRAEELLWAPDEGVADMPAAIITAANGGRFAQGNAIRAPFEKLIMDGAMRVYDGTGRFLGMAASGPGGQIRPLKVLASTIP